MAPLTTELLSKPRSKSQDKRIISQSLAKLSFLNIFGLFNEH